MTAKRHTASLSACGRRDAGTGHTPMPGSLYGNSGPVKTPAATPVGAYLTLDLPEDVLEAVAVRAAQLVAHGVGAVVEPWIGVDEAAEHLACPKSRLYRLVSRERGGRDSNPLPYVKDGARLLFKRSELDRWVEKGGAGA